MHYDLYEKLKNQLSTEDILSRATFYEGIPTAPEGIYIVLGDEDTKPYQTKLEQGYLQTAIIHVWARSDEVAQVKQVMDRIYPLVLSDLDGYILSGFEEGSTRYEKEERIHGTLKINYKKEV